MSAMLDAALEYAARGWAVLPLEVGGKRPITAHGCKDATTDADQVRAWWTETPDANVGVATGAVSGITVLDVDVKPWKNKHGDKTLAALIGEHGSLPPTLVQTTWSGGTQYVFAYARGVGNSTGRVGKDLDIRGDGGYIVVPPSRVGEDGREGVYAWLTDPAQMSLAAMPSWLLDRVKSEGAGTVETNGTRANTPGWADEKVSGVTEGSRDQDCVRLLGRYSTMRPPLSKDEVLAFMFAWAEQCHPPFPEETICEKVERLFEKYSSHELLRYPLTDAGNAERTVALHVDRFRWLTDTEDWLAWDGRRWAPGSADQVRRYALDAARQVQASAVRLDADKREDGVPSKKKAMLHGLESESARAVNAAVTLARLSPDIQATSADFDQAPDLLNCANGTLDLRTFELRPHAPSDRLTRIITTPYEPDAKAPAWLRFLDEVFLGKAEVIEYVQRCVGYTLTGSIEEQCLFFLHGSGANGKSTFVAVLTALLGEYATKLDQEAVLTPDRKQRGATPELVVLVGKRFAYVDELEEGRQLDEARVKALTGSERGTGRALYKDQREWTNTAKLWLDLNHLPDFKGIDLGIERRLRVIPFDRRFEEQEQDRRMVEKLKVELPGILAWAVQGCRTWRALGLEHRPAAVELATRRYRDENNHLPVFVDEYYELRAGAAVSVADLQRDYAAFCSERGEPQLDYQRKVVRYLRDGLKLSLNRTNKTRTWSGLRPRTAAQ